MHFVAELLDLALVIWAFILFTQYAYAGYQAIRALRAGENGFIKPVSLLCLSGAAAGLYAVVDISIRHIAPDLMTVEIYIVVLKVWRFGIYGITTLALHLLFQNLQKGRS